LLSDDEVMVDVVAALSGKQSTQESIGLMIFRITNAETDWEM